MDMPLLRGIMIPVMPSLLRAFLSWGPSTMMGVSWLSSISSSSSLVRSSRVFL